MPVWLVSSAYTDSTGNISTHRLTSGRIAQTHSDVDEAQDRRQLHLSALVSAMTDMYFVCVSMVPEIPIRDY